MNLSIVNIKSLLQVRESKINKLSGVNIKKLPVLSDAYLVIKDGKILDYGEMKNYKPPKGLKEFDATGRIVMPTWYDSHTHIVYASNREQEFVDRINGLTYEEIAAKGGGILNSADALQNTPEDVLYADAEQRLKSLIKMGTGGIEIKSGYGLTLDSEIKMLSVIKRLKQNFKIPIKATFLAAHAVPKSYNGDSSLYVDAIINTMLPKISELGLADYIDVFCEKNYFTVKDTDRIIKAGKAHHLKAKIHVNQFNSIGGVKVAVENNALSVDHLEVLTPDDLNVLKQGSTLAVVLPTCSFFLGIPYAPARQLIDENISLVLASDFNPGSTPSGNMNFVVSTACIKMKITPEEAINAATLNGAYAMGIDDTHGSITVGKQANLIITDPISSYHFLPYSFGENNIHKVLINGEFIN